MIPLKDHLRRERPPLVVWTIIVVNALVFLYSLSLSERDEALFQHLYGAVPARFTNPSWAAWAGYPDGGWDCLVTYMFLHAGWWHFLLNMWALWIFADNLEDVLGSARFTVFYLACGLAAAAAHILAHPFSTIPVVGASGAVAGVMGGYLRLFPRARITTLIPILFIPLFMDVPAALFLGLWFLLQLFSGLAAATGPEGAASVAFWAHVGGFLAGLALIRLVMGRGGSKAARGGRL